MKIVDTSTALEAATIALRTYGAGLLSSFGEITNLANAELRSFDTQAMGEFDAYEISTFQDVLFVAASFDDAEARLKLGQGEIDDAARDLVFFALRHFLQGGQGGGAGSCGVRGRQPHAHPVLQHRRSGGHARRCGHTLEDVFVEISRVAERVRELTGGKGADIVFNTVGDPYFQAAHKSLALRGRQILIAAGEKFALVGESGSGKSITALSVLRLVDAAVSKIGRAHV